MSSGARFPVLFIGHGNPMYAIEDNTFTRALARLGRELPRPKAILCVSAHWMTEGTWAGHMAKPKTIHDFYGFPDALFAVDYPAAGAPKTAERVKTLLGDAIVSLDEEDWGLDHGAWSVLCHMYPKADVPVAQLSLDLARPANHHFALGQALAPLRDEGVLILGSGNIVHNLREMNWKADARPHEWAVAFDAWVKDRLSASDHTALVGEYQNAPGGALSVPTPDHWFPFLYALGASGGDAAHYEHEGIDNASISMRCVRFGV